MLKVTTFLLFILLVNPFAILAQTSLIEPPVFEEIELLVQRGDNVNEKSVNVTFADDQMLIESKNRQISKIFLYTDIRSAEYSYSKNPRWKTGLGIGAAAFIFPPLFLVAIPLGFSKHRRHWLTIKTENDYAVLKLSKSNRKIFIPTFETKTGVKVEAIGEDK